MVIHLGYDMLCAIDMLPWCIIRRGVEDCPVDRPSASKEIYNTREGDMKNIYFCFIVLLRLFLSMPVMAQTRSEVK